MVKWTYQVAHIQGKRRFLLSHLLNLSLQAFSPLYNVPSFFPISEAVYQLTLILNNRFKILFKANLFTHRAFERNTFFHISFSLRFRSWVLNRGLSSNKATHYLQCHESAIAKLYHTLFIYFKHCQCFYTNCISISKNVIYFLSQR